MPETTLEITGVNLETPIISEDHESVDIEVPRTPRIAYRSTNNLVDVQSSQTCSEHQTREHTDVTQKKAIILLMLTIGSISDALSHTFILSIFETIFFWSYISVQEDKALRRNLFQLQNIVTEMCKQYDIVSAISIEDLVKVNSREREDHNQGLLNTSIFLCLSLLAVTLTSTFVCAIVPMTYKESPSNGKLVVRSFRKRWVRESMKSLSSSVLPITAISIYEIMFFQTVVKLYMPISAEEVYIDLFDKCF
jgi:hypothetical protein